MIPVLRPDMGEDEVAAVAEVIRSNWIGLGPKTAEFESAFADYLGASCAVGLNSCTSALDMALRLLGVGHRAEVLVPTMTFVSTAHVVAYNLATPVFVDVDPETLAIDIDDMADKITSRTRAIIPVHHGGRPVDMDRLRDAAGDIPIVEDAAHACGASYKGAKCGTLGDMAAFSFHAVKNLAMGDGGALVESDQRGEVRDLVDEYVRRLAYGRHGDHMPLAAELVVLHLGVTALGAADSLGEDHRFARVAAAADQAEIRSLLTICNLLSLQRLDKSVVIRKP